MQVDSGADANVINENTYNNLVPRPHLWQTSSKLKPYNSKPIHVKGYFMANFQANGKKSESRVYVTSGNKCNNLLGKYTAFDLSILHISVETLSGEIHQSEKSSVTSHQHKSIETTHMSYTEMAEHLTSAEQCKQILASLPSSNDPTENETVKAIKDLYPNVFQGIGKHKYRQVKLAMDESARVQPFVQPRRKIPFAKRPQLEKILDELESEDIVEKVECPTDWVSNLVLTPKANPKELQMNIDMTTVNPAIKRAHHVIPTIDELKYKLNGSQHFTKLDMKQGYMKFELHEDSRHLTTFYTHQGLRRVKRLMFGINAAAEIFHEEISRTLSGINNVTDIYDDILIYAKTQKEHDIALLQTLQRLSDCNLTLNPKKCIYNKSRIQFFGVIFSKEGVTPARDKIQALMNMEQPTSASEIRSFLGMANFSCHFIKNYSNVTAPLRALTHKNAKFEWTIECQTAFDTNSHSSEGRFLKCIL